MGFPGQPEDDKKIICFETELSSQRATFTKGKGQKKLSIATRIMEKEDSVRISR